MSYQDLIAWKKSIDLVEKVYGLTALFPQQELYGLSSQMRRCAVSIPSNIAEGSRRGTAKDFRQFVLIAYGSGSELETQLIIANRLSYGSTKFLLETRVILDDVMRLLNRLIKSLSV